MSGPRLTAATRAGDILTGSGPGARWKPKTARTAQKAYGSWVRYLSDHGALLDGASVGARLTEANLRGYIAALRGRVSPRTGVTRLRCLSQAIAAMDPAADRELLKLAIARLERIAVPSRDKTPGLRTPSELLELGRKLMTTWRERQAHDPRLNAMDYRDGLMIGFLALCPLRLENLAQMRIGEHLRFAGDSMWVAFEGYETKCGKAIEFAFPEELRPGLDDYLRHIHPLLFEGAQLGAPLWPSLHKRKVEMSAHGIYTRITQVTAAHFGHPVTPHLFRDAAATFIAEMMPERALIAVSVLQQSGFEITRKHYIHGQQHLAAHMYHAAIAELLRRSRHGADEVEV
jgi:integrase/recombinase XerD